VHEEESRNMVHAEGSISVLGSASQRLTLIVNETDDSKRVLAVLRKNGIDVDVVHETQSDPEGWPDASLPALVVPRDDRDLPVKLIRGYRNIHTQFLSRLRITA
jgi:hypothetical protein